MFSCDRFAAEFDRRFIQNEQLLELLSVFNKSPQFSCQKIA